MWKRFWQAIQIGKEGKKGNGDILCALAICAPSWSAQLLIQYFQPELDWWAGINRRMFAVYIGGTLSMLWQFISWQIPRWPWSAKILTASCWCTAVHWDDKKSSQVSSRCKMLTRKNVSGYGRSEWSWRGSRRLWEGGRREKYCLGAEPATCLTSNSPDIITSPIPLDPTYDIHACT